MSTVQDEVAQVADNWATEGLAMGVDHLGYLRSTLGNLRGYDALAHELIQNADDAAAGVLSFDVTDDALIVFNDAEFKSCGSPAAPQCRWPADPARHGQLCDFHRIRKIASGNKTKGHGTIGAFGIGFTAVYQVTDAPEVISAGQHWRFEQWQSDSDRVKPCRGCARCRGQLGTTFYFPWARDPNSAMRSELQVETVPEDGLTHLLVQLEQIVPKAILFLKHLSHIDVLRNGELLRSVHCEEDGDRLVVTDGQASQAWHLLHGSFAEQAAHLRLRYPGVIDADRSSDVVVALPADDLKSGLLYVFLPTQHDTGLPFHVNADFFPASDRKTVLFEQTPQGEWNRAAIRGAASALRDGLLRLRDRLGHQRLWQVVKSLHDVERSSAGNPRQAPMADFWAVVSPVLRSAEIMLTTRGEWRTPADTLLLRDTEEEAAIPVLETLDVALAHADLRPYLFGLPWQNMLGMEILSLPLLVRVMRAKGLTGRQETSDLPGVLKTPDGRKLLWQECARLLRQRAGVDAAVERGLGECAIWPGSDGAFWPRDRLYKADKATQVLFGELNPTLRFVVEQEGLQAFEKFWRPLNVTAALAILEAYSPEELQRAYEENRLNPDNVLAWFEAKRQETLSLRQRLVALPICPSAAGLRALHDLLLPGDFDDPLGLTELVAVDQLSPRVQLLLRDLGAKELDFARYAREHLPAALAQKALSDTQRRKAVVLLATRKGEVADDPAVRQTLARLPIVECEAPDKKRADFRLPAAVYFRNDVTALVLGGAAVYAVLPADHLESVSDLYRWLGVAERLRPQDVVTRVRQVAGSPATREAQRAIRVIFEYLTVRFQQGAANKDKAAFDRERAAYAPLQTLAWLPSQRDASIWRRPADLFAGYQAYLFNMSGAKFLDMPMDVQRAGGDLLRFLGVLLTPSTALVVEHLLACCHAGEPVNKEVYVWLNNHSDEEPIQRLVGEACILLPGDYYVGADRVFWDDHPFGRFRYRLGQNFAEYAKLLNRLGVRQKPDWRDTKRVIEDIATEYAKDAVNRELSEDDYQVLIGCWRTLGQALEDGKAVPKDIHSLRQQRTIANARHMLMSPGLMLFDDRPGLAEKFESYLRQNVIVRPETAWRAMRAAGVRDLSHVVERRLVEREVAIDPASAEVVLSRIRQRRSQLNRVLQELVEGACVERAFVDSLQALPARRLNIQYVLSRALFGHERTSPVESAAAYLDAETSCLYFVRDRAPALFWAAIAKELLTSVCPTRAATSVLAPMKDVLAAQTAAEAIGMLDALEFPPLEDAEDVQVDGVYAEDFGGEARPEDAGDTVEDGADETAGEAVANGGDGSVEMPQGGDIDPVRALLGDGVPSPTPGVAAPSEFASGRAPAGNGAKRGSGGTRPERRGSTAASTGHNRLLSYVVPSDGAGEPQENPDLAEHRDKLGRAGIQRVLAFEGANGRVPVEMAQNNPGYDIESRDGSAEVVRYIEVKAMPGDWSGREYGAAVSKTQYDAARTLGDRFWLYVVERAEQDDFTVRRIQNPVSRVDQYVFDSGWQGIAEVQDVTAASA